MTEHKQTETVLTQRLLIAARLRVPPLSRPWTLHSRPVVQSFCSTCSRHGDERLRSSGNLTDLDGRAVSSWSILSQVADCGREDTNIVFSGLSVILTLQDQGFCRFFFRISFSNLHNLADRRYRDVIQHEPTQILFFFLFVLFCLVIVNTFCDIHLVLHSTTEVCLESMYSNIS